MRAERRAAAALSALFWVLSSGGAGCVDPIVVGDQPACEPACPDGLHCDLEVERCVQCKVDDECSARLNAPYCEGFGCVQCRSTEDCANGRLCAAGACVQCLRDSDCGTSREPFETHVCQLGACVDRFP